MASFHRTRKAFGMVCLLGVILFQIMYFKWPRVYAMDAQANTMAVVPVGYNFPIARNTGGEVKGKPGVAFDGTNFLVPYIQGTDVYARRVSPQGILLDTQAISISVGLNQAVAPPSVSFDGTNYLIVWNAQRSGMYELYGARVTPSGTVLDRGGVRITIGGNPIIRMPSITFDGTNYLVVWRTNLNQIYAARISPTLVNLDAPAGFPVATTGTSYYPSVAFDGSNYLVVWHDSRNGGDWDIYGARITPQGNVLDPNGFVICNEPMKQEHTSIGFDGTNYLVAWYDWRPNDDQIFGSVYGTRVSPSGNILDSPSFQIADRARGQFQPNVVCGEGDCLVVWNTDYPNSGTKFRLSDVWGRRISSTGAIIDQQGIPIATAFGHQFGAVAGYGNGRYLVAWGESTGRESIGAVYGQVLQQQTASQIHAVEDHPRELSTLNQSQRVWVSEPAPIVQYATAGIAFSPRNAYAFGYPSVHYQNNNWEVCPSCPSGTIYGSWANNLNNLWIGGWCRMLARYDGQNWSGGGCWTSYGTWDIVTGIWGSDASHIWATADRGDILRYDGVHHWNTIRTGIPFDLSDLWGTSVNNIYAVGERGTILHYNGMGWRVVSGIPSYQRLNAVWGSGPNDIFVVGDWGEILHFNGNEWRRMTSGTLNHLHDVWGLSGSNVYAVGFNGTILHYDGTSWSIENSNTTMDLLSVWGVMSECRLTIWAAGSGAQILKSETPTHCMFLPVIFR